MPDLENDLFDYIDAPVFVLEIDQAGRPTYTGFNRAASSAAGISLDDILGKTAEEVYPGRFGKIAYRHHVETARSARSATYELSLPLNGSIRRVRTTLQPVTADDGKVVRLIGTSIDVSAEHLIRETTASGQVLDSEIEQFVSLAAHDLRSPMRRISFLADMLREDFQDLGDGKLELIGRLENVAAKTMSLISDVLSYEEASRAAPGEQRFDFAELCSDILVTLDPMAEHVAHFSPAVIQGDRTATHIVLRNLIDNAIKHGERASIELDLTLEPRGDDRFQVTIRDNGRGFRDPDVAFLDGGEFRYGSGFGLLGVRRLIEARGGTIRARAPDCGSGAIVEFTLPGRILAADVARTA